MPVKTSGVRKYKPGTAEYIVLHGQWRQSRGKRLSAIFSWERNPKIALEIAKQIAYFPTGAGGQYLGGAVPSSYTCCKCQAHGVKLWRDWQTFRARLLCVRCAAAETNTDISQLRSDGSIPKEASGQFTCKIGMRVPAVPSEDGYGWWGLGYIPNSGARWWLNLPNFNRK